MIQKIARFILGQVFMVAFAYSIDQGAISRLVRAQVKAFSFDTVRDFQEQWLHLPLLFKQEIN
jgi:hypothetical protein